MTLLMVKKNKTMNMVIAASTRQQGGNLMLLMVQGRLWWWVYVVVLYRRKKPHQPTQAKRKPTLGGSRVPIAEQRNSSKDGKQASGPTKAERPISGPRPCCRPRYPSAA